MTMDKALRIQELRVGIRTHSWRALSEVICAEFADEDRGLSGNQLHGQALCQEAMMLLYGVETLSELSEEVRDVWGT